MATLISLRQIFIVKDGSVHNVRFFSYLRHLRREMSITLVLTFYLGSAYLPFVRDKIFLTTNVYPLS